MLLGENVFNWTDRNTVSRFYTSDSFVGTRLYLTSIIFLVISGTIICREYLSLPASDCSQWKKLFAAKYVYIYIYIQAGLCNEDYTAEFFFPFLFMHIHMHIEERKGRGEKILSSSSNFASYVEITYGYKSSGLFSD